MYDSFRKVATLQLLAGYISLAGGHVPLMVNSLPHLSRLVKALVQVSPDFLLVWDAHNSKLKVLGPITNAYLTISTNFTQTMVLERGSGHMTVTSLPTLDPSHLSTMPLPLPYAHFHSDKVAALLGEVGRLLGCHGDLSVLVDYILDELQVHTTLHCEHLLLLSHVLAGGGHKGCGHTEAPPTCISHEELFVVVEGIINRLITPDIWIQSHTSEQSLNSDLQSFMLINVVFTSVHVLEVNFEPLLQQLVYYLMVKLSSSHMGVANAAMATLETVCSHCGYQ